MQRTDKDSPSVVKNSVLLLVGLKKGQTRYEGSFVRVGVPEELALVLKKRFLASDALLVHQM